MSARNHIYMYVAFFVSLILQYTISIIKLKIPICSSHMNIFSHAVTSVVLKVIKFLQFDFHKCSIVCMISSWKCMYASNHQQNCSHKVEHTIFSHSALQYQPEISELFIYDMKKELNLQLFRCIDYTCQRMDNSILLH